MESVDSGEQGDLLPLAFLKRVVVINLERKPYYGKFIRTDEEANR